APRVVVLGKSEHVGLRIVRRAHEHGVRSFVFADPDAGTVSQQSTYAMVGSIVGQRAHAIWSRRVPGLRRLPGHVAGSAVSSALWLGHRFGGRSFDEWLFVKRAGLLFRRAQMIDAGLGPPASTVLLAIGNLASGGSERQAVNTALMIKRSGR